MGVEPTQNDFRFSDGLRARGGGDGAGSMLVVEFVPSEVLLGVSDVELGRSLS